MRFLFLASVVIVIQLFSYGTGASLQWLLKPWLSQNWLRLLMPLVFILSNVLVVVALLRLHPLAFRWISAWMVLMLFVLMSALMTWVIWLLTKQMLPTATMDMGLRILGVAGVVGLFAYALHSAYVPTVRHLTIEIDKPLATPVRVAVASDLHLGRLFGSKQLDWLTATLKKEQVDMLLMPGDIMDDDTQVYETEGMQKHLAALTQSVTQGVYATQGNHDLYRDERGIIEAIQDAGIHLLMDEAVKVGDVWVVGRPDDHKSRRLETTELLKKTNTSEPIILLDHRPSEIELHSQLPIDLQVSGHTHNGQIFPANIIVKFMNRLAYGHERIGEGHYVVTSGFGFWAIPFRLGSRSEIWVIDVEGQPANQLAN